MADRLDGTVALVTGASSGIGEATARELAAQGAAVGVAARRRDRLDALAAGIEDAGGRALVLEADVTDTEQARATVQRTVDELGRLDAVINNAGVMLLGPAVGAPAEGWDRMVALNVGADSEALRQELAPRHVRVSLVEPDAVATELSSHLRPEIREQAMERFRKVERLEAEDIADAIAYVVTRPRRMAVNEMLVRPTQQEN